MNWTKISSSLPSVQVWSIMFSINKRRLITSRNMTIYSGREGLKTRFRGVKRDVGRWYIGYSVANERKVPRRRCRKEEAKEDTLTIN